MCLLTQAVFLGAAEVSQEMDTLLKSAESLFQSMQQKEYARIWELLSQKSRQTIANDTFKALKSQQIDITEEQVYQDFTAGSELAKAYWDSFVNNFNPILILEQSKWEIGKIKGDQAQIKITYRKAEKPAFLKMYKQDGIWKVGLTESFWAGKSRLQ